MEEYQLWPSLPLCSHSGFLSVAVLSTHLHAYSTPAPGPLLGNESATRV